MNGKSRRGGMMFYFLLLGILIIGLIYSSNADRNAEQYTHADFVQWINAKQVETVYVTPFVEAPNGNVIVVMADKTRRTFNVTDVSEIVKETEAAGVKVIVNDVAATPSAEAAAIRRCSTSVRAVRK